MAYLAGQADAGTQSGAAAQVKTAEAAEKTGYAYLESRLSDTNAATADGIRYSIRETDKGFVTSIDRAKGYGGYVTDARSHAYDGGPFATRQEAVSDLLAVARQSFYPEADQNNGTNHGGLSDDLRRVHSDAGRVETSTGEASDDRGREGTRPRNTRSGETPTLQRLNRINPDFGEKPIRAWTKGHIIQPTEGSAAHAAQQTAMEYGIPSFVVAEKAWAENMGQTEAFSAEGQIYFREALPEAQRGMHAPHA